MISQRVFAIFIGIIMVTSVAGWALGYVRPFQSTPQIKTTYERFLAPQEKISILRSGKVLIEYFYLSNCSGCLERKKFYENFVNKFEDFAVLEVVEVLEANETLEQMIGMGGDIESLENTTQVELMKNFCDLAIIQPRECLLEGI